MNHSIEYNGRKTWFEMPSMAPGGLFYDMAPPNAIGVVPDNATLTVCAWCFPASEQQPLKDAGFTLSHGICRHCLERQRGKEAV